MFDVGQYIKELRLSKGLTQEELGELIGVQKAAVYKWECGKVQNLKRATIQKLADFFNVSPASFIEYPRSYKTAQIPVLGKVAAGVPTEALEDVLDYVDIPEEMAQNGDYFGLRIKGHSMEPRIWDGDTVIVRRQEWVEDGSIAVVNVNGYDTTCKKVKYSDMGVTLISFNPIYEPMFFSKEQATVEPFVILGRVVEIRSKV